MGLDMYLTRELWVSESAWVKSLGDEITVKNFIGEEFKVHPHKISYVIENVGYWRKCNQIHNWFVENVQDGVDECDSYYVTYEKLMELRDICKRVLANPSLAPELLPTQGGFFFGSTDYDEGYFDDLRDTVKILESLEETGDYKYQASW